MVARARWPVKDKGALMQILAHLRFGCGLRAISMGQSPGRWPPPSMRPASTWKGAPPLPNHPKPTCAVGLPSEVSNPRRDRCPMSGAGLPQVARLRRAARIVGPCGADPCRRVCLRQTASELIHDPARHEAGDHGAAHWQARASEDQRSASFGLSFPLRPQPFEGRASREKTAAPVADVGASAGVSGGACRQFARALRRPRPSSAGG